MAPPVEVSRGSQDPMPEASPAAGSQQVEVPTAGEASLPPTTPSASEQVEVPTAGEASLPPTTPSASEQVEVPTADDASLLPTTPTTSEQVEVPAAADASLLPATPTTSGVAVADWPKSVEPVQESRDILASPIRADDGDEELSALLMANVVSCQQSQFSNMLKSLARLFYVCKTLGSLISNLATVLRTSAAQQSATTMATVPAPPSS